MVSTVLLCENCKHYKTASCVVCSGHAWQLWIPWSVNLPEIAGSTTEGSFRRAHCCEHAGKNFRRFPPCVVSRGYWAGEYGTRDTKNHGDIEHWEDFFFKQVTLNLGNIIPGEQNPGNYKPRGKAPCRTRTLGTYHSGDIEPKEHRTLKR